MIKKELAEYVDNIFARHKPTKEINELKEEILSNLEEKAEDYIEQGLTPAKAFAKAVQHIDSADLIIGGNKRIYINRYWLELIQTALIYSLLIWILTMPSRILLEEARLNTTMLLASIVVGIVYLLAGWRIRHTTPNKVSLVNTENIRKWQKRVWIIWVVFILVIVGAMAALRFGSNLWFWRSIEISGPYQFAMLSYSFLSPLISIVIPLLFTKACTLLGQYEVYE
ncbi:permease prefix domain 1-containing protein [Aneurinibacillus sp. REN35]|uniref:permease prefix domain 1-containing protein n=1 Tax=Aneurinibacillus sp. REN35 TaxID=3237286 RepID=UPI00352850E9